jgi:hypothetical protein
MVFNFVSHLGLESAQLGADVFVVEFAFSHVRDSAGCVVVRNRMAATTSPRIFHSAEPGDASARQRLPARNPTRWAAAAAG